MNIKKHLRSLYFFFAKRRLQKKDFTVISNNCIAGCILHDFRMRFDTPTINLFIPFPDYIQFVRNLKENVTKEIVDITGESPYPVGLLGGQIHIHFLHYKDFDSAVESWRKRTKRIHWDKLFFVLVERDGCTTKDLADFNALNYKHKVVLTHKAYDKLETFTITGFEKDKELGNIMIDKGMFGKKYYDQFDWIRFLNQI